MGRKIENQHWFYENHRIPFLIHQFNFDNIAYWYCLFIPRFMTYFSLSSNNGYTFIHYYFINVLCMIRQLYQSETHTKIKRFLFIFHRKENLEYIVKIAFKRMSWNFCSNNAIKKHIELKYNNTPWVKRFFFCNFGKMSSLHLFDYISNLLGIILSGLKDELWSEAISNTFQRKKEWTE